MTYNALAEMIQLGFFVHVAMAALMCFPDLGLYMLIRRFKRLHALLKTGSHAQFAMKPEFEALAAKLVPVQAIHARGYRKFAAANVAVAVLLIGALFVMPVTSEERLSLPLAVLAIALAFMPAAVSLASRLASGRLIARQFEPPLEDLERRAQEAG